MKFTARTVAVIDDRRWHPLPRQLGEDDRADGLRDEVAPARLRRPDAETQEAQARLQEDRRRDAEGGHHGQRSEDVGQHVPEQDRPVGHADDARRGDELRFAQDQELAAHEPARHRPAEQADDRDDRDDARADERHEHDDQQQRRDGHDRVGEAHDPLVDEPAVEAGGQPDQRADDQVQGHRPEADQDRRAGAVQDARPDVARRDVRAQDVLRARRLAGAGREVDPVRRPRRQERGERPPSR